MTKSIGARRTALIFVAAATMMFACSSDGQSPLTTAELPEAAPEEPAPEEPAPEQPAPEDPAPEEPAPEEPAPEQPAPEEPAPEQPAPEDPTDDGLTSQQWTLIILGALLVIAVIAGVAAMMSRRSKGSGVASSQQARLDGIVRNARTIHDSTVLTVLQPNEPAGLQSVWSVAQRQLIDLEVEVKSLTAEVADAAVLPVLQQLDVAVTGVRGALESNVSLRLGSEDQAALVEASNQTALTRRAELEVALQQAASLRL